MSDAPPLERWLEHHRNLVAIAVLGIGFLIRIRAAGHDYLSPDEALIYAVASQPSLLSSYRLSLMEAHPPLVFFLLHFIQQFGHAELLLRLPSVLAGTVLPWFAYKWLKTFFGARTGWIGLLLLTFSPAVISQSVEARHYALLLLFLVAALYFLERAFAEDSAASMAVFAVFLVLATATHYSALFFAIAVGLYALGRIRREPPPRAVTCAWLGAMVGTAALLGFFYVTHVAKLRSSGLTSWMKNASWISELYFHPAKTGALAFVLARSVWFFQYLFGQALIGFLMLFLFLITVCLLLDTNLPLPGKAPPRLLALLLFLPFLLACGAALAQLYPYGPAREALWLAPFGFAGVSYGLAQLGGSRRGWPGLGLATLMVLCGLYTAPLGIRLSPDLGKGVFEEPLSYIRHAVPQNQPILTDYSTILTLGYYLCADRGLPVEALGHGFAEYRCGGYRFLVSRQSTFTPANFLAAVEEATRTGGLRAGEWLWVAHVGWGDHFQEKLAGRFPKLRLLARHTLEEGVSVFQVEIPLPNNGER